MKNSIIIIAMLGVFSVSFGQNNQEEPLTRKERKELRKQQTLENKQELLNSIDNRTWVLEAHTVFDRYGNSVPTSPNTNFIMVNGDQSVIQLAFPHFIGYNGIGGITFEDEVGTYEVVRGKKENDSITLSMEVNGINIGNAHVTLHAGANGNARATVRGPWGWRITYSGELMPLEESNAYTGQSLF